MTMIDVIIDETQIKEITRKIIKVSDPHQYRKEMQSALDFTEAKMKKYPQKSKGAFSRLALPQQKKAFWAKVNRGEAKVDGQGYVRTDKLKNNWYNKQVARVGSLEGAVSNRVNYAIWVQSAIRQQPFHHESKWMTPIEFFDKHGDEIMKIFDLGVANKIK